MQSEPAVTDADSVVPTPAPFPWRSATRTAWHALFLGSLAGLATAAIFSVGVGVVMWQEKNIEFDEIGSSAVETFWEVAPKQIGSGALAALAVFGAFAAVGHYLRSRAVTLATPAIEENSPVSPTVALIRADREKRRREDN